MKFHSGKRLKLAKEIKGWIYERIYQDLACGESTVKRWVNKGIPSIEISKVANYFDVETWVFEDPNLTVENFEKIIRDPSLQNQYRPDLIFTFKGRGTDSRKVSDVFPINCKTVLLRVSLFKVKKEGHFHSTFILDEQNLHQIEQSHRISNRLYEPYTVHFYEQSNDLIQDEIVEEKIIAIHNKAEYRINGSTKYDFQASVYKRK
jgi:hypothetical protein